MAWRPLVALSTSISWFSSIVVSAKMLRASSSTTSTLRPRSASFEPCRRSSILRLPSGSSAMTRCRNSAVSSSSRSGDCTSLSTMLLATSCSRAPPPAVSSLPVNTTIGMSLQRRVGLQPLEQLEAGHVGQPQVDDAAVEGSLAQRLQRLGAGADGRRSRCRRAPSSSTMLSRSTSLSSMTSSRLVCGAT